MASTDNAGSYYNPGWYRAGRAVWTLVFRRYLQVRITGEPYMPVRGPAVLAANHISNLDPFLIGCVLHSAHPVAFMAKQELFALRPLAFLMRSWGGFPVDRSKKDAGALRTALSVLRAGEILGMFPEGTRSTTDQMEELRTGAVRLALRVGAPLIPVGLWGTNKALPPGGRLPRRAKIGIAFGPHLTFAGAVAGRPTPAEIEEYSHRLQAAIRAQIQTAAELWAGGSVAARRF
jgi:1-acyl-sn-glycerol-3-phosphate acyltransferase